MKKLLFLLLFVPSLAGATSYYVDATLGLDSNNGKDPLTPWKTVAKVNTSSFLPGDSVLFKRGELWRERLVFPSSGQPNNPITIADYGAATRAPRFDGSQVIANSLFSKTSGQTNVYEATGTAITGIISTQMVWENQSGTSTSRLSVQASTSAVDANPGSFFFWSVTNKFYVHATDNSNIITSTNVYEVPKSTENIYLSQNYVNLSNLWCEKTAPDDTGVGGVNVGQANADHVIVTNLLTNNHRRHAIIFYQHATNCQLLNSEALDGWNSSPLAVYGSGTNNILIKNSSFHDQVGSSWYPAVAHGGVDKVTFDGDIFYNGVTASLGLGDGDAVTNLTVKNCNVYGSPDGIRFNFVAGSSNVVVQNNLVTAGSDAALIFSASGNVNPVTVTGNTLVGLSNSSYLVNMNATMTGVTFSKNYGYASAAAAGMLGFYVNTATGIAIINNVLDGANIQTNSLVFVTNSKTGNTIYNNTFLNETSGIYAIRAFSGGGFTAKNNIFSNCYGAYQTDNTSTATVTTDYNDIWGQTNVGIWAGQTVPTLAVWRSTSSQDTNSIARDPGLTGTYVLLSTSAVINEGVNLGSVIDDYQNKPRISPTDMGAFEFFNYRWWDIGRP